MIVKSWLAFTLAVICLGNVVTAEDSDDECSRFSAREFYASVFEPALNERVDFLKLALTKALEGVEETMVGLEERKGASNMVDIAAVRQSKTKIRSNTFKC